MKCTLRHREYEILNQAAGVLAGMLKPYFGKLLLGPEYPMVSRIRNQYIKNIILKTGKGKDAAQLKFEVARQIEKFLELPDYKSVRVQLDVDPM
jgi:primosomal protein N' (replication factor Y) (superfamily II helicase)